MEKVILRRNSRHRLLEKYSRHLTVRRISDYKAAAELRRSLTSKSWIKVPRPRRISEEVRESEDNCEVLSDREVQEAARCKWHCFSPILDP